MLNDAHLYAYYLKYCDTTNDVFFFEGRRYSASILRKRVFGHGYNFNWAEHMTKPLAGAHFTFYRNTTAWKDYMVFTYPRINKAFEFNPLPEIYEYLDSKFDDADRLCLRLQHVRIVGLRAWEWRTRASEEMRDRGMSKRVRHMRQTGPHCLVYLRDAGIEELIGVPML